MLPLVFPRKLTLVPTYCPGHKVSIRRVSQLEALSPEFHRLGHFRGIG